MKKIFLVFILALVYSFSFGQFPSTQTSGTPSTLVKSKGAYGSDSGYVFIHSYPDTTTANYGWLKNIAGIIIRVGNELYMRNSAMTKWNIIGGGNISPNWLLTGNDVVMGQYLGSNNTVPFLLKANDTTVGFISDTLVTFGDVYGTFHDTKIDINDRDSTISLKSNGVVGLGDVAGYGRGTTFLVDDRVRTIRGNTLKFGVGSGVNANGNYSVALGYNTSANGYNSTAMGEASIAGGDFSTAMGSVNTASGDYSTAIGRSNTVSGIQSVVIGSNLTNSQDSTIKLGFTTSNLSIKAGNNLYNNIAEDSVLTTDVDGNLKLVMGGGSGGSQSLQDVTDVGSTTTNAMTVIKADDNIAFSVNGTDTQTKIDMGNSVDNAGYMNFHNSSDVETIGFDGQSGNITAKNATLNNLASGASTDSIVTVTPAGVIRKINASAFSGTDSASYHTTTQITDSSFSLNRPNGTSDTIIIAGTDTTSLSNRIDQKLDSIRLVNSGVLFASPAAFVKSNTTGVVTQTLATQSAYTNFGNNTASSATPIFFTNNFSDSLKRSNDSIYRRVNGVFIYQYKDSIGGGSSGWGLTGNTGTTAGTNFLGTTDSVDFVLKAKSNELILAKANGKIFIDSIQVGAGSGRNYNNIAIGDSALQRNTTGTGNVAIGDSALQLNTTGFDNTAIGNKAGRAITSNGGNTFVGSNAGLAVNSVGNTAVGNEALKAAAGNFNTALGFYALRANSGANNIAVGVNSLVANTSGSANIAIGYNAAAANLTGGSIVVIGDQAVKYGTGTYTTAVGASTLPNLTTGVANSCFGYNTGWGITTGSQNVIIGGQASALPGSRSNYVIINDGQGNAALTRDSLYRTGLGTITTPTALLHIAAGTTTIAPIKLTSGTNLTTPEAGTIEYNGTNLFFTPASAARNNVLITASVNTVSPTSPDRTITVVINGTTYYLAAKTTND